MLFLAPGHLPVTALLGSANRIKQPRILNGIRGCFIGCYLTQGL